MTKTIDWTAYIAQELSHSLEFVKRDKTLFSVTIAFITSKDNPPHHSSAAAAFSKGASRQFFPL